MPAFQAFFWSRWMKRYFPCPPARQPDRRKLRLERLETRVTPSSFVVLPAAAGEPPVVRGVDPQTGVERVRVTAFELTFTGGVRAAVADVTGDDTPDIVAGAGPGGGPRVQLFDGQTGQSVFSATAYEDAFTGGVWVSAGDVTGDGVPDLIVTPDEGGGPRVLVYDGARARDGVADRVADFFGIEDPAYRGGARAGVGDIDGDGRAEVVVTAGTGGGPRVSVFGGAALAAGRRAHPVSDFFAFDSGLRNGAYVGVADVNADGFAEVIVGAGAGGGPRVAVLGGKELAAGSWRTLADFFAGDPAGRDGAAVATADLDGDANADLLFEADRSFVWYAGSEVPTTPQPTPRAAPATTAGADAGTPVRITAIGGPRGRVGFTAAGAAPVEGGRGFTLATWDPVAHAFSNVQTLDTWADRDKLLDVAAYLRVAAPGAVIAVAVGDDAGLVNGQTGRLSFDPQVEPTLQALERLGGGRLRDVPFRGPYAAVLVKGGPVLAERAAGEGQSLTVEAVVPPAGATAMAAAPEAAPTGEITVSVEGGPEGGVRMVIDGQASYAWGGGAGHGRGITVAVVHRGRRDFADVQTFDTWSDPAQFAALDAYLRRVPAGALLLLAAGDEAGLIDWDTNRPWDRPEVEAGYHTLESLGSARVREVGYRGGWAMVVEKGRAVLAEAVSSPQERLTLAVPFPGRVPDAVSPTLVVVTHGQLVPSAETLGVNINQGAAFPLNFSPLSFISFGSGRRQGGGDWVDRLGNRVQAELVEGLRGTGAPVLVAEVNWDTFGGSNGPAAAAADRIAEIVGDTSLSPVPWDIIFLGHSRGAIFNDQVIRRLGLNDRVDQVEAVLLDPTASHLSGDLYPAGVPFAAAHEIAYDDGGSLNGPAADVVVAVFRAFGTKIGGALGKKIADSYGEAIGREVGGTVGEVIGEEVARHNPAVKDGEAVNDVKYEYRNVHPAVDEYIDAHGLPAEMLGHHALQTHVVIHDWYIDSAQLGEDVRAFVARKDPADARPGAAGEARVLPEVTIAPPSDAETLGSFLKRIRDKIKDELVERLAWYLVNPFLVYLRDPEEAVKKVVRVIKEAWDDTTAEIDRAIEAAPELIERAIEDVGREVQRVVDDVRREVQNVIDRAKRVVDDLWDDVTDWF